MEGDILLNLIVGLHPIARIVVEILAVVCSIAVGLIAITPYKGDDAALEHIKQMPVIGSFLAALLKFSPFGKKEEKV